MNRRGFLKGFGVAAAGTTLGYGDGKDHAPTEPTDRFTFAFFTDVHLHPEEEAPRGTRLAVDIMNSSRAEFAICGGDHILEGMAVSRDTALKHYELYTELEKGLQMPVRHVLGNHDVAGLLPQSGMSESDPVYGKALFQKTFDTPTYYSFWYKGAHFIVLDSIQIVGRGWQPRIDDTQVAWLKKTLETHSGAPTIVASHVPLVTAIANYAPGSENPIYRPVANNREIIPLLEQHNVIAVLQGHTHIMEKVNRHGVHYITGGAVSGNWWHGSQFGDREGVLFVTVGGAKTVKTSYQPTGFTSVAPRSA